MPLGLFLFLDGILFGRPACFQKLIFYSLLIGSEFDGPPKLTVESGS